MSNVTEMPEAMDFQELSACCQVLHNDRTVWLFEGLNGAIADAAKKSARYRKQTSVTLEIVFKPDAMDKMVIEPKLKTKDPDPRPIPYTAYTDRTGRLVMEDPNQTKLALDIDSKRRASNDRD